MAPETTASAILSPRLIASFGRIFADKIGDEFKLELECSYPCKSEPIHSPATSEGPSDHKDGPRDLKDGRSDLEDGPSDPEDN